MGANIVHLEPWKPMVTWAASREKPSRQEEGSDSPLCSALTKWQLEFCAQAWGPWHKK